MKSNSINPLKAYPRKAPIGLMVVFLVASLLIQGQTIYLPLVMNNPSPPLYSTSYYIQNPDPTKIFDLGCALGTRDAASPGTQDSLVILAFGKMWVFEVQGKTTYGVRTFSDPNNGYTRYNLSFAEVEARAQSFASGYWACSANDRASQLTLGIGVNSFDFFNQTNRTQDNMRGLAVDFGRNWANMINRLNAWAIPNGYRSQILFTGAMDIEWSGPDPDDGLYYWHTPYVVRGWVDTFDAYDNGTSIYFNFGACVGCPTESSPSWIYSTAMPWAQADIWYVSWGAQPAYSVPEIYRNDGYLARQWAAVSKYGSLVKGSRIVFSGVMTQMQACQQRSGSDPSCSSLDNTPAEGWAQLVDAISSDAFTQTNLPRWSTDIRWQIK